MNKIGLALSFVGAAALIAGCFYPVLTGPGIAITFFDKIPEAISGMPENTLRYSGIALIALAVSAGVLALTGRSKWNWIPGLISGIILAGAYWFMQMKIEELKEATDIKTDDLFGGLLRGVSNLLLNQFDIEGPGWFLAGAGAAVLIISSLSYFQPKKQSL